jgi:hypothetical protein
MNHLTRETIAALLSADAEGLDPARRQELRAHLAEDCEECERALAEEPSLDGALDALLLRLAPPKDSPLDEVGFRRVARALSGRRVRPVGIAALAAAAALAVGLFTALRPVGGPDRGLKGNPRIAVELTAALQDASGVVRRVEPGEALPPSGALLLRYHATEEGRALLLVRSGAGDAELLGSFVLAPGTHDLRAGSDIAGVPLSRARGPLTVSLVAAPFAEAISPEDARAAATSPGGSHSLAVAEVHFQIESP